MYTESTALQLFVSKILRRMEPTHAVLRFRRELPTMTDDAIRERCAMFRIRLDRSTLNVNVA